MGGWHNILSFGPPSDGAPLPSTGAEFLRVVASRICATGRRRALATQRTLVGYVLSCSEGVARSDPSG